MHSLLGSLRFRSALVAGLCCLPLLSHAGVLPEDRADLMYHSYSGGDVDVDGPSILVRKKFGEQVSFAANYLTDTVTSASIDVKMITGASTYVENRKQSSLAVDYLRGKTTYNLAYINSEESDYTAQTASIGVSEDMFGDLTTISIGYTRAWDDVSQNTYSADKVRTTTPVGTSDHRSYRFGISQILTKFLIVGLNYEGQTHEGELGSPYRKVRYRSGGGVTLADEKIPGTRTTNAVAVNGRYFLPYRAVVHGSYRFFTDTWGIQANTTEIGYLQPWRDWLFELSYRKHSQEAADFFIDLMPRADSQTFYARDRNFSTMTNQTIHLGVTYDFAKIESWTNSWLNKGSVNLFFDRIQFDYEDFRDATQSNALFTTNPVAPGTEQFYSESANVIRFFISAWF
jgi:hypothetical protein